MERVPGPTVKSWLQAGGAEGPFAMAVASHVGAAIARLHASGLSHGDLTTSNMILRGSRGCDGGDAILWEKLLEEGGLDGGDSRALWGLAPVNITAPANALLDPADDSGGEDCEEGPTGAEDECLAALSGVGTHAKQQELSETQRDMASPALAPKLPPLPGAVCECVLIDFGLACGAANLEDMGVDLYVLERALSSAHAKHALPLFAQVLESYTKHLAILAPNNHVGAKAVAGKFAAVRQRGRKRVAFG